MAIPRASADYYQRQQAILARLLYALRLTWRRMDPTARWNEQYAAGGIGAQLLMLVASAQVAAARDADAYVAAVLTELGLVQGARPGLVVPSAFAGVAGDGRSLESLLGRTVPLAGQRFNQLRGKVLTLPPRERPADIPEATWESLERDRAARHLEDTKRSITASATEALDDVGKWLETVAATAVIDAARGAESAATTTHREVGGWVRMLNPPSCSRCAVLAGRFYRWNDGFLRHPGCDCRHIPSSESLAGDLTVNPNTYFDSLSPSEQDRIFTKAGAEAIRNGADVSQVVNARRGMRRAQVYGHDVTLTSEGTTRRGVAYRSLQRGDRSSDYRVPGERYRRTASPRLMPDSILELSNGDRDEAIRLLRAHGYIT